MRYSVIFAGLVLTTSVLAQDNQEPRELTVLRTSYKAEVAKVVTPINIRYVDALIALKKKLGGAGDIEGAMLVEDATKALLDSLDSDKKIQIVGRWNRVSNNDIYIFEKEGTCRVGRIIGTWKLKGKDVVAIWNNGVTSTFVKMTDDKCQIVGGEGGFMVREKGAQK